MDRTRHGFHVKVVGDEIEKIPIPERISIRESIGDDPLRIEYDKLKLRLNLPFLIDCLFTMKRNYDKVLHIVESVDDPVALPWASRIPPLKTEQALFP